MNKDLKSCSLKELQEIILSVGGKKFHAKYIFNFIHSKLIDSIDDISPLSKLIRENLKEAGYYISSVTLVEKFIDPDSTVKYLFALHSGKRFETVLLSDNKRKTLCISSQVGCKMGCSFCATAKMKFSQNLCAGEILSQVYEVTKDIGRLDNIVFMGMGEPFDNYDEVMRAVYTLNNVDGQNIGARHITVSTCGLPDRILDFAQEKIQARLAISIHAGIDKNREKIMPISSRYPLKELTQAIRTYQAITNRRITLEYCLIKGVNDTKNECDALIGRIRGIKCNINIIEYNEHPGSDLSSSSKERITEFHKWLTDAGFETHIRFKRGEKIKAACGQLGANLLEGE